MISETRRRLTRNHSSPLAHCSLRTKQANSNAALMLQQGMLKTTGDNGSL